MTRKVAAHTMIRSFRIVFVPEFEKANKKEDCPTHEQSDHEPMDNVHHVIDLSAVCGIVFWEA
jgi:hypothetical protein